jgi:segregation and condensation protein B
MKTISPKSKIEAALYISGRPLGIDEIVKATRISDSDNIDQLIEQLRLQYDEAESALEIIKTSNNKYAFQLRAGFSDIVSKLAPSGLLSLGSLKTLSLIALKQPVKQYEVIKIRGSHAYKYVRELIEKGFVDGIPYGRTKILKTSKMFSDYFGLDLDPKKLKMQLRWKMRKDGLPEQLKILETEKVDHIEDESD